MVFVLIVALSALVLFVGYREFLIRRRKLGTRELSVEVLIGQLRSARYWIQRASAASSLGKMANPAALNALISVLLDPYEDLAVKQVALTAVQNIQDPKIVPTLVESLGFLPPALSQKIANIIVSYGPLAAAALMNGLSSNRVEERYWSARILGTIDDVQVIQCLIQSLNENSPRVRAELVHSLGRSGARAAVLPVSKLLLFDPDPYVQDAAAETLGLIGDERSIRDLVAKVQNETVEGQCRALQALEKMGERVVPYFIEMLQVGPVEVRRQAAIGLDRLGVVGAWLNELKEKQTSKPFHLLRLVASSGAVDTLIGGLGSCDLSMRVALCRILADSNQPRAIEPLRKLADRDSEWAVRLSAITALVRLMPHGQAAGLIEKLLNQEDEEVFKEQLIAAIRELPLALIEHLSGTVAKFLHHKNTAVRLESVKTIARGRGPINTTRLLLATRDASSEIRREAIVALQIHRTPEAIARLYECIDSEEPSLQREAIASLRRLNPSDLNKRLLAVFEKCDETCQIEIVKSLSESPDFDFNELLDRLMGSSSNRLRLEIANSAKLAKHVYGRELLGTLLSDEESSVRMSAIDCVAEYGEPHLIEKLRSMILIESDPQVVSRLILALVSLGENLSTIFIQDWLVENPGDSCKAAGFVSLTLMNDDSLFEKMWMDVSRVSFLIELKKTVYSLPDRVQKKFWELLGIESSLVLMEPLDSSIDFYGQRLIYTRDEKERLKAIRVLTVNRELCSMAIIEKCLTSDPSSAIRLAAVRLLKDWPVDETVVNLIIKITFDPVTEVREAGLTVLNQMNTAQLIEFREAMVPMLGNYLLSVRAVASGILAELYQNDCELLCDHVLGSKEERCFVGLLSVLGRLNSAFALTLIRKFTTYRTIAVRLAAVKELLKLGSLRAEEYLLLFSDPEPEMRVLALSYLGSFPDINARELLLSCLEDPSCEVRLKLVEVLIRFQEYALLQQLAQDADLAVRTAAEQTIKLRR